VIGLVKRVPAAAGLGGASSDAAATLVAANEAWRLGWSRERLAEVAGQLGSDVPFFLSEGAALCRGRGERMEALTAGRLSVVIVRPPVGLSTPRVYSVCRPSATASGAAALQASLARGDAAGVARYLKNDLMAPASSLTPWIGILRDEFDKQDVLGHQMSGSGSSYFGICRSNRQARRIAARLRARGMGMVVAARTIAVSSDAFQPQA
jgi:4-diphosphocytidyl-2-C-methyl-D-erythritol kinase